MICVVIPYFQRTPGVLRRALASIAAQRGCALPVHVIVVDDASPVPAAAEVDPVGPCGYTLQIVVQPNGGPGAARNTGMSHAPPATRYLAFLDSDDEWTPDHLARAVEALSHGYDFYFTDLYHIGQTVGAFARRGRLVPADHPLLPGASPDLHAYRGDLLDQTLRGNVIGTPTVVYDFERFRDKRFRTEFANAGEDYLFWMELAHAGARTAFSSRCEVHCGRGVNVYSGAGWGTEQHLLRIHNEIKFRKVAGRLFPVTPEQRAHLAGGIGELRVAFARDLLHRAAHGRKWPLGLLRSHWRVDPGTYWRLPAAWGRLLLRRG
jgi:succinoglycan biosynthesis protein ExoW